MRLYLKIFTRVVAVLGGMLAAACLVLWAGFRLLQYLHHYVGDLGLFIFGFLVVCSFIAVLFWIAEHE